jgi:hypothetical protein
VLAKQGLKIKMNKQMNEGGINIPVVLQETPGYRSLNYRSEKDTHQYSPGERSGELHTGLQVASHTRTFNQEDEKFTGNNKLLKETMLKKPDLKYDETEVSALNKEIDFQDMLKPMIAKIKNIQERLSAHKENLKIALADQEKATQALNVLDLRSDGAGISEEHMVDQEVARAKEGIVATEIELKASVAKIVEMAEKEPAIAKAVKEDSVAMAIPAVSEAIANIIPISQAPRSEQVEAKNIPSMIVPTIIELLGADNINPKDAMTIAQTAYNEFLEEVIAMIQVLNISNDSRARLAGECTAKIQKVSRANDINLVKKGNDDIQLEIPSVLSLINQAQSDILKISQEAPPAADDYNYAQAA